MVSLDLLLLEQLYVCWTLHFIVNLMFNPPFMLSLLFFTTNETFSWCLQDLP